MSTHPLIPDDDDVNSLLASGVFIESPVDLSRFRNSKGEFTRWLQVFYLHEYDDERDPFLRVTHVLPWLCDDDKVDLEFHRAASALGAYEKYPLVWRSFGWKIKPLPRSPHYALFTVNPSRDAFKQQLQKFAGGYITNTEFWKALEHHVLVPGERGILAPKIWTNTTTE